MTPTLSKAAGRAVSMDAHLKGSGPLQAVTHFVAIVIVILQLAELYGPLGAWLGMPSLRPLTTGLMVATLACLTANPSNTLTILRYRTARLWTYLIWIAPVAITILQYSFSIISFDDAFYYTGFISSFGVLFLVSVYAFAFIRKAFIVLIFSLVFAGISVGFLVDFFDFSFIRKVLFLRVSEVATYTRINRLVGFFPHPNVAALSTLLIAVTIMTSFAQRGRQYALKFSLLAFSLGVLLLTGSRTSIILLSLFLAAAMVFWVRKRRSQMLTSDEIAAALILIGLTMLAALLASSSLNGIGDAFMVGLARALSLFMLNSPDGIADQSAYARLYVLPQYIEYSMQSPLLGYGLRATESLVGSGRFGNVSQNLWIQWSIEYGYIYVIFAAYVFGSTWRQAVKTKRASAAMFDRAEALQLLLLVLFVASFSINTMFMLRAVVVCLGVSIGLLIRASLLTKVTDAAQVGADADMRVLMSVRAVGRAAT